jgi:hypothetical protein
LRRRCGRSRALPTVVFGYAGGAASPTDSRKVDGSVLIVAESGDFLERSNSSLNSKSHAHLTVRATGIFKAAKIFATTNQLIRQDENNRVGIGEDLQNVVNRLDADLSELKVLPSKAARLAFRFGRTCGPRYYLRAVPGMAASNCLV